MNPATWLLDTAKRSPLSPALIVGTETKANYRDFARSAASISAMLQQQYRLQKGDRVAIFASNSIAYLELLYGIWFAGGCAVPINAKLHPKEAAWIIEDAQASLCFCSPDRFQPLEDALDEAKVPLVALQDGSFDTPSDGEIEMAPAALSSDDMIWLFYTSGTTGRPKGVMITCGNIEAMVHSYLEGVDEVHESDTIYYAAPMSHGAGIYNFQHVLKGARHAVGPSAGFDPAEIFSAARNLGNLHFFAAPTMVKRLVDHAKEHGETGEGIRTIVYGGGPMYLADIIEAVDVLGNRFCQIYGQGESPMCITQLTRTQITDRSHPRWKERLQSVGTAQSCVEVRVVDGDGVELEPGQTGEILVKGASVMKGYWNNPSATENSLRDGWLWTGDMGSFDAAGFLTLKDRSKDMIISGGSNIYPREVEEVLLIHGDVDEVSVVGDAHAEWGEIVVAFVKLHESSKQNDNMAQKLDAHCLDHIARFKRPKQY